MIFRWLNKHSLNFKLNVSILTCVFAGVFVLAYFISKNSVPIIISQIDSLALKTVSTYAADFDHLVRDSEQIVINAKNTLNQAKEDDTDSLHKVLTSAIKTVTNDELELTEAWVYTFNAEDVSKGVLYISEKIEDGSVNFHSEEISNLYSRFPWFKEVPKEEKIYWSEPYVDKKNGNIVVTCILPFMFEGKDDFNGLTAVTVDLNEIKRSINAFSQNEAGKLIMISKSGLYVMHTDENIALKMTIFELADKIKAPQLREAGTKALDGESGIVLLKSSSVYSGEAIVFYAPIKLIGWGLYLVYDPKILLRPIHRFQLGMAIGLIIVVLSLLLLIGRICKNSTNQLISLSQLANKYGFGDFSQIFEGVPSSSDINVLSQALSNMRSNLLEYMEKERKSVAEKQKSKSEMEIARNIQKSALSTKYPKHDAFAISAVMDPAREIGGDFYDFFFVDENKFAIVIADVSGKGIPAALYMMKAQTLIKNICGEGYKLDEVLFRVNNQLYEGNDTCMFVTAFIAVVDLNTGDVEYVNAGHTPPLVGKNGISEYISPEKNIILGVKKNATFCLEKTKLSAGEHILLYTDGVTEAENKSSDFYGAERLKKICLKAGENPEENLRFIMEDVKYFVQDNIQSDDITMLNFVYLKNGNSGSVKEIEFPADNKKLRDLIDFLKKDSEEAGVESRKQFNLVTAAEEIFANIADYAYGSAEKKVAWIKTYIQDDMYMVEFSDCGKKYNPLENKEPDISSDLKNRKIGGLGIFMAKKLSDKISYSYENGRNILTLGIKKKAS